MFGWFDRDRLQSAGPNSHIAVTAAIPLPATIIVAVYGATEGKAPNASVKTPAVEVSAPVKSMSRSKTASTAHTNAAASTAHAVTAHAMAAHAPAVSTLPGSCQRCRLSLARGAFFRRAFGRGWTRKGFILVLDAI